MIPPKLFARSSGFLVPTTVDGLGQKNKYYHLSDR